MSKFININGRNINVDNITYWDDRGTIYFVGGTTLKLTPGAVNTIEGKLKGWV